MIAALYARKRTDQFGSQRWAALGGLPGRIRRTYAARTRGWQVHDSSTDRPNQAVVRTIWGRRGEPAGRPSLEETWSWFCWLPLTA